MFHGPQHIKTFRWRPPHPQDEIGRDAVLLGFRAGFLDHLAIPHVQRELRPVVDAVAMFAGL